MASISVKSGGSYRTPSHVWIRSGGTWRDCSSVWVRSGGVWRQVFSRGTFTVVANSGTADANGNNPTGTTTARLVFRSTGAITRDMTAGIGDNSTGSTAWLSAVGTGNGAGFYVRASVLSGSPSTGTTGVWQSLASDVTFTLTSNSGVSTCSLSVDFATDGSGSNIVSSGNSWTLRNTHAGP